MYVLFVHDEFWLRCPFIQKPSQTKCGDSIVARAKPRRSEKLAR